MSNKYAVSAIVIGMAKKDDSRTCVMCFAISEQERKELDALAKKDGVSRSSFLFRLVQKVLSSENVS